ncbi:hypothetical protein [Pantoea sp. Fr+CA_20]|uniref:hypothetical protein n=1 Tax=Pantoea sp. Fr+CA_20 TaxID=2929506 RepID=UPI002118C15A|nr:hypothetical protein [Pantoea sp. Fr+CA_20]
MTEERYQSTDLYFNNFFHLLKAYQDLDQLFNDKVFKDFVMAEDKSIFTDLHVTGKVLLALLNFYRVMQKEGMDLKREYKAI